MESQADNKDPRTKRGHANGRPTESLRVRRYGARRLDGVAALKTERDTASRNYKRCIAELKEKYDWITPSGNTIPEDVTDLHQAFNCPCFPGRHDQPVKNVRTDRGDGLPRLREKPCIFVPCHARRRSFSVAHTNANAFAAAVLQHRVTTASVCDCHLSPQQRLWRGILDIRSPDIGQDRGAIRACRRPA